MSKKLMTPKAYNRIITAELRRNNGIIPKNSFSLRALKAVEKSLKSGKISK